MMAAAAASPFDRASLSREIREARNTAAKPTPASSVLFFKSSRARCIRIGRKEEKKKASWCQSEGLGDGGAAAAGLRLQEQRAAIYRERRKRKETASAAPPALVLCLSPIANAALRDRDGSRRELMRDL